MKTLGRPETIERSDTGAQRLAGLEFIAYTDPSTSLESEPAKQWFYTTGYVYNEPLRDKEHVRALLLSLDGEFHKITFHTLGESELFVQSAAYDGDIFIVETNVPGGGWAQSILRDGYGEVNDISSPHFGNMEIIDDNQYFTLDEAAMLCRLWIDRQIIPEGYVTGPIEGFGNYI